MGQSDHRATVREFLRSRRERITPERAGLPAHGGNRRVKGLRREEVAMLAGVSVDYFVRMERGNLSGVSDGVLTAVGRALQLDEAERDHLFALARRATSGGRVEATVVRPAIQQVLDAISDAPAWVRNGRHDFVAVNGLARALYAPVFADARRPANTARFLYLDPVAREFFVDWDRSAANMVALLRLEVGRAPHDPGLRELVCELSSSSELFRRHWASHDVHHHHNGFKRIQHPVVGRLDLDYESMELAADPGLVLNVYTAVAGTPAAADGLKMLASWAASHNILVT